ncbi:PAS domain-containing sensor histidine kinase [Halorubrum ezzemoulense]|uniref:histidine kinase n=1 Tax=Halorubrum ezzemoulense TaxID=337243 RepID=A0ABT4Z743_HALEZ|nr:PAS domain-containing sensor histidine kinase [Halorubrum ezzemoulense]MDB2245165.1 PAS domain-containing sensor histidine kinase [Halorubrum ezzemoulense]MDB2278076.1 PAS domain-containing sensor histidine kinase [Halorubrum ezzemoulense]MDB2288501.1 PAS domain-containing sensor histidine kinase [Halorubrum ezzemoulense]MDB2293772.1 PAS domain-containing sensor histidine kinase [Halorubrum ezzemoulense]MDB2294711.1 PAS domain-containing sensor histidine kinase [Halorubrum ezzemoulense]
MSRSPEPETLVDLAQDKVAVIDEKGRFRYLNAATRELLGFDPDTLVGTDAFDLIHPDDADRVRTAFEALVAGGTAPESPLEYRYATADGDWVWFRTRVFPPSETGLDGYALSSRDVTLEVESRRRLETIASTSPDVLWMFSADWEDLLFVNGALESVFGIEPDALERRPQMFLAAVHPDDRPAVEDAMERLSDGEPTNLDYRIGPADGRTTWVRVPSRPVWEDGEVVAVAGFARDVTDEYRRERQLTVMDNLLRHTIRNDMNIVDGTAERIADRVEDAVSATATEERGIVPDELDLAELAADLIDHAETVRRVADDLLTTAEKQRGVIDLLRHHEHPQPLRVAPLVESAVADAVDDRSSPTAEISVSCPGDVRAFTHPELDYAIAELIENAIEHAEAAPSVEIEVTAPADRVKIAVRDNAPPIPPAERDPITDRWKMDDLRHTGGMGLWLVYWIADRSGGDLAFDAGADGNEVTICVPDADCDPGDSTVDRTHPVAPDARPTPAGPDAGEMTPVVSSPPSDVEVAESTSADAETAKSPPSDAGTTQPESEAGGAESADPEPTGSEPIDSGLSASETPADPDGPPDSPPGSTNG